MCYLLIVRRLHNQIVLPVSFDIIIILKLRLSIFQSHDNTAKENFCVGRMSGNLQGMTSFVRTWNILKTETYTNK